MADLSELPHDDYGPELNAITGLMLVLSASFVFTRIYLKISQHRNLWWDDYILVLAWVSTRLAVAVCLVADRIADCPPGQLILLVVGTLLCIEVSLGYGRHSWDISPTDLPSVAVYGSVAGTLTILGSAFSKTSFALTLLRLPIGWLRYLVWFILITMNILMDLSAVSVWFECRPQAGPSQDSPQWCLPVDAALEYAVFVGGEWPTQLEWLHVASARSN